MTLSHAMMVSVSITKALIQGQEEGRWDAKTVKFVANKQGEGFGGCTVALIYVYDDSQIQRRA